MSEHCWHLCKHAIGCIATCLMKFSVLSFLILATTLDATNKSVKWDVVGDTKDFPNPFYKLIVRQFLLGHTAKEDEYNVVEVSIVIR